MIPCCHTAPTSACAWPGAGATRIVTGTTESATSRSMTTASTVTLQLAKRLGAVIQVVLMMTIALVILSAMMRTGVSVPYLVVAVGAMTILNVSDQHVQSVCQTLRLASIQTAVQMMIALLTQPCLFVLMSSCVWEAVELMKTVRATTKSVISQGTQTATTAMQQMIFLLEHVLQVVPMTTIALATLSAMMSTCVCVPFLVVVVASVGAMLILNVPEQHVRSVYQILGLASIQNAVQMMIALVTQPCLCVLMSSCVWEAVE